MSRDDAPGYRLADRCFYCKHIKLSPPAGKRLDDSCQKHNFKFNDTEAHTYVCNHFADWRKKESSEFGSKTIDKEFLEWFVSYLNKATLDDLKHEPLEFNERMAYLHKKFEESKGAKIPGGTWFRSGLDKNSY